ncbi:hypothetical protein VI08_00875 [Luteibacter yeojuensis]|uniref:PDZ domain-containing protein n=1 Tax=Luteibacter yeojuensis TaxID=345309 RepID=A0A0F3L1N8_9GAMM|nr:hypothetical protein VI08_00875 [Luteibacter yeojuensis]
MGGPFVSRVSHIRQLDIGPVAVRGHVAQLTPPDAGATANVSEAGNIGQDILSRFHVGFDYRRGEMSLAQRTEMRAVQMNDPGMRAGRKPGALDRFTVAGVVTGGPAYKAGVRAGDAILAVDGVPAAKLGGWGLRDRFDRAKEGDKVVLTMADGHKATLVLADFAPR